MPVCIIWNSQLLMEMLKLWRKYRIISLSEAYFNYISCHGFYMATFLFGLLDYCALLHATLVFFQAITLNVAINSHNQSLFTIVVSNQFVELKGSAFKKFEKNNLFQMSCSGKYFKCYHIHRDCLACLFFCTSHRHHTRLCYRKCLKLLQAGTNFPCPEDLATGRP